MRQLPGQYPHRGIRNVAWLQTSRCKTQTGQRQNMITSRCTAQMHAGTSFSSPNVYNSSSSSILVSMVGMLPSEFPRSFVAPINAWPRLLRTLSSNPGNEARCFLKGDATVFEEAGSVDEFAGGEKEASLADELSGAGVPDRGDPEASETEGPAGRPTGSAECWRLSFIQLALHITSLY
jgi:hypothetical protein